jgi:hypothetical protein
MQLPKILFVLASFAQTEPTNVVNVHNNLHLSQMNTAALEQNMSNALNRAHDLLNDGKKECSSLFQNSLYYVSNNKKRCFFYSLITSYLGIIATLWLLQIKINKGYWKTWKKESTLENLFSIKQQDLAQQLLLDIQLHYINPAAPTDTTEPISKFLMDIAREEYYIKRYLDMIVFLERLHIVRFIYFKTEKQKYEEYATRINCVKGLFTLWLSEYKVSLLQEKTLQEK